MNRNRKKDSGLRIRYNRVFDKPLPSFSKPNPIGYFSVDTLREYDRSARQLKYFRYPTADMFPMNLNVGLDEAIKKPERGAQIDLLLKYICDHLDELLKKPDELSNAAILQADFICYRGMLKLIMCTPYEYREDWCILATSYKNSIYLCKKDTNQELFKIANETPQQKRMSAWGFKFEQYCLTDSPDTLPNTNDPVDECSEFNCVFRTNLNGMDLFYSAEMDGIISNDIVDLDENPQILEELNFIELKTCRELRTAQDRKTFYISKIRNWWCQSFLAGISDIYKGVRDDLGNIHRVEKVLVESLPKMSKNRWQANVCTDFLVEFLTMVRSVCGTTNDPYTTFVFYFNPNDSRINYEMRPGKTEFSFLPDWYIRQFDRTAQTSQKTFKQ